MTGSLGLDWGRSGVFGTAQNVVTRMSHFFADALLTG
jgi:hypothetical protein